MDHGRTERLRIRNGSDAERTLWVEPWGECFSLGPRASLEIVATGPAGDPLEVAVGTEGITVFAWSGATLEVIASGKRLGGSSIPAP